MWQSIKILQIQNGGGPPFWKWFYRYISAGNHPISMKFGVLTQILVKRTVTCWFIKIWNSKWPTAAILKIVFWLNLHELLSDWRGIRYVQVKSCSDTCRVTKIVIFENSRWRAVAILKMVSSLYLSRGSSDFNEIWCATADFGSKDDHVIKYKTFASSKWRTAAILKIVFGYISTIYCPINAKFDMKKQNYVQIQVTWPKYQNLKIQHGGRSPFWKRFHHLRCGSSDFNEIWCAAA